MVVCRVTERNTANFAVQIATRLVVITADGNDAG